MYVNEREVEEEEGRRKEGGKGGTEEGGNRKVRLWFPVVAL